MKAGGGAGEHHASAWLPYARDPLASKRFLAGRDACLATDVAWAKPGALQMFTRQERKH